MSYGLYLYKETISVGGRTMRLEIWEKDYVGASAEIEAMGVPPFTISLDNSGGKVETPLIKTNATIIIKDTGQIDYDTLFTPDATKYKVIIKVAGIDYWYGFLTPDSFSQALSYKSDIILTARDNLGMLASFRYERAGARATMRTLLNEAMTLISFGNTLEYRQIKTSGTTNILDGYIRADKYIGGTWADAVEEILHDCGLQMRFIGGAKYAVYDIGDIASLGTTLATQSFQFINKSGNKEIVPAVKDIKLSQNYGSIDNSYDGVLNADDYSLRAVRAVAQPTNQYILQPETYNINYYDPLSSIWDGAGGVQGIVNPNEWNELPSTIMITGDLYTLTTYRQAISYSQIMPVTESNVEIKMKVSNLVKYPSVIDGKAIWKDLFFMFLADPRTSIYWSGAHYRIKLRYNIFLVSATKTYVMREQWEEFTDTNPSVGTYLTFLLPSGGSDGGVPIFKDYNARDEEITFNIQTIPEDGVLQIAFYPYEIVGQFVQEYPSVVPQDIKNNIPLTYPILIKDITIKYPAAEIGGLDSQAIISADHNVSLDVNLNLGQVPSGLGDSATMQGGIYSSGANYYKALGNFFRTAGTEYHLSELIGREIVNIYKVQREKLSGQIINSTNYAALPSFGKTFTANGKLYALNFGSLDFASEVMQVELVEIEAYETEDFTFVEAAIDAGGGTNLGSGDTTFLQWSAAGNATRIYSLDTATEAEQAGAYVVIDKSGMASAKKVALIDLLVDAYTKSESDAKYALVAGDILKPFSTSKLTATTLLIPQVPSTLSSGEVGLYALESGFSGEVPGGAGSVTSIGLSMPTGFSVSGSPITESGTFGVTFASGYRMFTETEIGNKVETSLIGAANGITPLDSGGKVALQYLPNTLLKYIGVWNASTNTPTLTNPDTTKKGYVYNVSVAGTQFGIAFKLGDWLIYNDSGVPEKSDNSDDVTSVNGYTGAVTLKTSDIAEQTNLYYTDARVKAYADLNYLGISAKAADSDKLDGQDSTYFATSALNYKSIYNDLTTTTLIATSIVTNTYSLFHGTIKIIDFNNGQNSVIYISGTQDSSGVILKNYATSLGVSYAINIFNYNGFLHLFLSGVPIYSIIEAYVTSEAYQDYGGLNVVTALTKANKPSEIANEIAIVPNITYNSANSNSTSFAWSAAKLTSTTLILPQSAPSLTSGEMAIYGLESGFSGETPSGAGSVTSISMVVPTGLSVTPATITESGTFAISYTAGYQMMTATESSKLAGIAANANNYSLPTATLTDLGGVKIGSNITITEGVISVHNAVTLGENQNGLSLSTQVLSLGLASASTNGALSSTDWSTFNGKEPAIGTKGTAFNKNFGTTAGTVLEGRTFGTAAAAATTDFLAANGKAADSDLFDGINSDKFIYGNTVGAATVYTTVDINSIEKSGFYYLNPATANYPATNYGRLIHLGYLAAGLGYNGQIWMSEASNNLYFRIQIGTTWQSWKEIYHSGNSNLTSVNWSAATMTMTENINTNLRIPKVAPTSPTSGEYYFYIVE